MYFFPFLITFKKNKHKHFLSPALKMDERIWLILKWKQYSSPTQSFSISYKFCQVSFAKNNQISIMTQDIHWNRKRIDFDWINLVFLQYFNHDNRRFVKICTLASYVLKAKLN